MPARCKIDQVLRHYTGNRKDLRRILTQDEDGLSQRKIKILGVIADFRPKQQALNECTERIIDCHSIYDIDPVRRSCISKILG